jgi:hypothetical protein
MLAVAASAPHLRQNSVMLTLRALNRATLARQLLLERAAIAPAKAMAQVAGMQAQVPKPPFIGLWSRLDGFEREALRKALARGDVVRGTLMRGTLHLAAKKDFAPWRAALQPVLTQGERTITRGGDVDLEGTLAAARAFFAERPRTFEEVRQHLVTRFPDTNDRLLGYTARMHLPLVMVPDDSTWSFPPDSQFALTETAEADLHGLALRYLGAFGPATPADFQAWSGLRAMTKLFDTLRPKLQTFRDDRGRELFDLPRSPRPDEETPAPVRFLPEYDNLVLAHADRTRIIADEYRPRIVTKNLRVLATFLVDGFVAGTWSIARKTKSATLTIAPFAKLTRADRAALTDEGERLLRFAESDAKTFAVGFAA